MKKKIPYAVSNLEKLRKENYYFIDKTRFIEELENYEVPVFLRPRRFGKTLWCSILECYYDINRKSSFNSLFNSLYIGKNPTGLQNSFLVLRLNFSVVEVKHDIDFLEDAFNRSVNQSLQQCIYRYRSFFKDNVRYSPEKNIFDHLKAILSCIEENNLPPLYLIIDEYDNFTNQLIVSRQDALYYTLTTTGRGGDFFFCSFFKLVKVGCESGAIGRVFITGVLPVTIDDLTSGFNIAEIVTLKEHLHDMAGFTQEEVEGYVKSVFQAYGFEENRIPEILDLLQVHYNGYRFLESVDSLLYNSTILTYFLKNFVLSKGKIPREMLDPNLKTDLSWLNRLTTREERTKELVEDLLSRGILAYDTKELSSHFNLHRFFDKEHYPHSLFYLGMLTIQDNYSMAFPNQTVKEIFADYYYELQRLGGADTYVAFFRRFLEDHDLKALFAGYWEAYISQIPAQAFDKMNENFFRITFFELCSRYLRNKFTFGIEVNYPSGRSDWEMLGKRGSGFDNKKWLIEFKYFTNTQGTKQKILNLTKPLDSELTQIAAYEKDILARYPEYRIIKGIIYVVGNRGFRYFEVE